MVDCDHRGKSGGNRRVLVGSYCRVDTGNQNTPEEVNQAFPQTLSIMETSSKHFLIALSGAVLTPSLSFRGLWPSVDGVGAGVWTADPRRG
jgi:hypothetical protein